MSKIAFLLDYTPDYLQGDKLSSSLLTLRVGPSTLLKHWCNRLTQAGLQPIVVLPEPCPAQEYKQQLKSGAPGVRVLRSDKVAGFLRDCELTDELIVINPRYYPLSNVGLATPPAINHQPGVLHRTWAPGLRTDIQERVVVDADRRVRRIERLYAGITSVDSVSVVCSLLSVATARHLNQFNHATLSTLRASLVLGGVCSQDVPLDDLVIDLSTEEGLLNLNEHLLQQTPPQGLDVSIHQIRPGIWAAAKCQIHPDSRLSGPVMICHDSRIQAHVRIIGPTVLGAGATIGRDSILARCIVGDHVQVPPGSHFVDRVLLAPNSPTVKTKPASWLDQLETEHVRHELRHTALTSHGNGRRNGRIYLACKRLFDCTAALGGLILLSPLVLLVALAIKLTSYGPIFFAHSRESRGGRPFRCWKFRTMVDNAHAQQRALYAQNAVDGPQFKLENDPRVTPLGRILRATNLDEIPQLINVLCGEMSLVGPRPSPFRENQICIPWREARLSVLPGITGLWQVCRHDRENGDFHQWIYYDVLYARHRSFALDLRILLATALTLGGRWSMPVSWLIPGYRAERSSIPDAGGRSKPEAAPDFTAAAELVHD